MEINNNININEDLKNNLLTVKEFILGIDHVAIAVNSLDESTNYFLEKFGFLLVNKLETKGDSSSMISAVVSSEGFHIVFLQGTSRNDQVTNYIKKYGPGVHHIAFSVKDINLVFEKLKSNGVIFDTDIIDGPGLKQAFTKRHLDSGMMIEIIERNGEKNFSSKNVNSLFSQLEKKGAV